MYALMMKYVDLSENGTSIEFWQTQNEMKWNERMFLFRHRHHRNQIQCLLFDWFLTWRKNYWLLFYWFASSKNSMSNRKGTTYAHTLSRRYNEEASKNTMISTEVNHRHSTHISTVCIQNRRLITDIPIRIPIS